MAMAKKMTGLMEKQDYHGWTEDKAWILRRRFRRDCRV